MKIYKIVSLLILVCLCISACNKGQDSNHSDDLSGVLMIGEKILDAPFFGSNVSQTFDETAEKSKTIKIGECSNEYLYIETVSNWYGKYQRYVIPGTDKELHLPENGISFSVDLLNVVELNIQQDYNEESIKTAVEDALSECEWFDPSEYNTIDVSIENGASGNAEIIEVFYKSEHQGLRYKYVSVSIEDNAIVSINYDRICDDDEIVNLSINEDLAKELLNKEIKSRFNTKISKLVGDYEIKLTYLYSIHDKLYICYFVTVEYSIDGNNNNSRNGYGILIPLEMVS